MASEALEARGVEGCATLIDGQWHATVKCKGAGEGTAEQIGSAVRVAVQRASELNRASK